MKHLLTIFFAFFLTLSAFATQPSWERPGHPFLIEFTVYPNPTSGNLTLTLETLEDVNGPIEMKVYSLIGQEMKKETLMPFDGIKKIQLDLTNLPKGMYMIELTNGDRSRVKRVSVI